MARLMNDQSNLFSPETWQDSLNATGLLVSVPGPTPYALPDGPTIGRHGPDRVLVPASQRQAKVKGLMTLVTSGLIGIDSSASADLQSRLANRLVQRLDMAGSTLFRLTWRQRTTPLGRRYLERAALVPRTNDSACISWPTPQRSDTTGGQAKRSDGRSNLNDYAMLSAWATPCVPNGGRITANRADMGKHQDGTKAQIGLENQARLAAFGETPHGYLLGPSGWEIVPACGQLNPRHAAWMQGLPAIWDICSLRAADTLSRSSRKRKRAPCACVDTETRST